MKQVQVSILPNAHGKEENGRKRTDGERSGLVWVSSSISPPKGLKEFASVF